MQLVNNPGISPNSRPLCRARQTGAKMKPSLPDIYAHCLIKRQDCSIFVKLYQPASHIHMLHDERERWKYEFHLHMPWNRTSQKNGINPNNGNSDVETNDHDDNDFNENQNLVYIPGDFKHVRLITNNKSTKDYVTCIISVTEESTVTFLRSSGACLRKFVYSIIEDQSQITVKSVI